jgi:hypothetical protein
MKKCGSNGDSKIIRAASKTGWPCQIARHDKQKVNHPVGLTKYKGTWVMRRTIECKQVSDRESKEYKVMCPLWSYISLRLSENWIGGGETALMFFPKPREIMDSRRSQKDELKIMSKTSRTNEGTLSRHYESFDQILSWLPLLRGARYAGDMVMTRWFWFDNFNVLQKSATDQRITNQH